MPRQMHPNSLANLVKPGGFGNGQTPPSGGRKAGTKNFKKAIREFLQEMDTIDGGPGNEYKPLLKRLWIIIGRLEGKDSDALNAIKLILDRMDGPVPNKVQTETDNPLSGLSDIDLDELLKDM